jgi:hypothetical protein
MTDDDRRCDKETADRALGRDSAGFLEHRVLADLSFNTELVHVGQAVLALGGKVDYFVNTVFNYPTLAECYQTAAFDGINRLGAS